MKNNCYSLERIVTKDGFEFDGIVREPTRRSGKALVWVHGLTSTFYNGHRRIRELSALCEKNGIAFASFNNRGHDIVTPLHKRDRRRRKGYKRALGGAGIERFEDCVFDIDAVIAFLKRKGYRDIFLTGHSTGANKVLYYVFKTQNRNIRGLGLLAPLSDIAAEKKIMGKEFEKTLAKVKEFARRSGRKKLVPQTITYQIISAERYLSLYSSGSREDVFPYYNTRAKFKELRSIMKPILVVVGENDEHLDMSAEKLVKIFRKHAVSTNAFSGKIIKGASHNFTNKEAQLAKVIINWIKE